MLNYEQLKYVLSIFKKIHRQDIFIKNYVKNFPESEIITIIADVESLSLFEAKIYLDNIMK